MYSQPYLGREARQLDVGKTVCHESPYGVEFLFGKSFIIDETLFAATVLSVDQIADTVDSEHQRLINGSAGLSVEQQGALWPAWRHRAIFLRWSFGLPLHFDRVRPKKDWQAIRNHTLPPKIFSGSITSG